MRSICNKSGATPTNADCLNVHMRDAYGSPVFSTGPASDSFARKVTTDNRINIGAKRRVRLLYYPHAQIEDVSVSVLSTKRPCKWNNLTFVGTTAAPPPPQRWSRRGERTEKEGRQSKCLSSLPLVRSSSSTLKSVGLEAGRGQ